ncbi:DUF6585 family protein [Actinomadura macrotermitis]|uniref:Uncharacterized protein n=1 Tax=Actinomadura macrotermitis TaxID=2585200 RepID=A0A7K0C4Q5_9ACTN|nr:DUF6585 family protein [Actinomadura macrotermitis]MQY08102.1 hypothetical protein [Actinomadura macrotermitis]
MAEQSLTAPGAPVTSLAAGARLGGLHAVYQPKQRPLRSRWNDWRLYLFDEGLIVTGSGGFQMAFAWHSATVFQHLRAAACTLVGPARQAVTIGRGTTGPLRLKVGGERIRSVVRGAPFLYEGDWGPAIQAGVVRRQLPAALDRLHRGEPLDFGRLAITGDGVTVRNRSLPWAEVADIHVGNGSLWISDRRRRPLPGLPAGEIANLTLALTLCERLRVRQV